MYVPEADIPRRSRIEERRISAQLHFNALDLYLSFQMAHLNATF